MRLLAVDGTQSGATPVGLEGDLLGCSVAVDVNTVVVGACGRATAAVHTGTVPTADKRPGTGAVYVYLRPYQVGETGRRTTATPRAPRICPHLDHMSVEPHVQRRCATR